MDKNTADNAVENKEKVDVKRKGFIKLTLPLFVMIFLFIRLLFFSPTGYNDIIENALHVSGTGEAFSYVPLGGTDESLSTYACFLPIITGYIARFTHLHPALYLRLVIPFALGVAMFFLYKKIIALFSEKLSSLFAALLTVVIYVVFTPAWSPVFITVFFAIPLLIFSFVSKEKMAWTGVVISVLTLVLTVSISDKGMSIPGGLDICDLTNVHSVANSAAADKEVRMISGIITAGGGTARVISDEKVMSEIGEISLQAKAPLILKKGGRFSAESGLNEGEIKNLRGIEDDLDINGYSQEKLIQHAYTLSCDYIAVPKLIPGEMIGIDAPASSLPGYEMFGEFGFFAVGETDGYVIFKRG